MERNTHLKMGMTNPTNANCMESLEFLPVDLLFALALIILPFDACTFVFWLIGVEAPMPEKKEKLPLRDSNPCRLGEPTANRILIRGQQHQRALRWAQKTIPRGKAVAWVSLRKNELTTAPNLILSSRLR
jgi:hypothetical protein